MADNRDEDGWRGGGRGRSESIFGGTERGGGGDDDRGFFGRAGDEVRSWFGEDDGRRRDQDEGRASSGREWDRREPWGGGDYGGGSGRSGDFGGYGGSSGGHPQSWNQAQERGGGGDGRGIRGSGASGRGSPFDDHYRSWRQRQIEQLDSDYEEYCRENQQRFESDFHSWRQGRQSAAAVGTGDAEAAATSTGGTGLGSSASFGSSNSDLEPNETAGESGSGAAGKA